MADRPQHPVEMLRGAIPRPQFFLLLIVISILAQFAISGFRITSSDQHLYHDGSIRMLPSSILLITAHPDDEAMFFAPAIQALTAAGTVVSALCLSTGNAAGLGSKRVQELYASYQELGVPATRVKYLDDAKLEDSMDSLWPINYISKVVAKHIDSLSTPVEALVTFDKGGVSGHVNHMATYNGTRDLAVARNLPLYVLPSLEIWEKYNSVPFAVWETITYSGHPPVAVKEEGKAMEFKPAQDIHILASPQQYVRGVQAMLKHQTQLEWFRWLYLVFSRYMFSNRLVLWSPELDLDLDD
ncbi:related to N-acetylglucosaminyl-phosphatidylinositol de-N-acetylase [Melanopsichium pennsylvanicum]|uniref:N-acetylglucosaminylphosphatidylinositol deacetylase n=2 Tax=Melanopsichium pennsylvanicum TaxID=63383 RepID=A0AAJ5C2J9_9BASI|nr:related to N-acetylglucosaminyl-phosphatidylinositol de-N-acetylase [Melanopsichium pennsylvanicum]